MQKISLSKAKVMYQKGYVIIGNPSHREFNDFAHRKLYLTPSRFTRIWPQGEVNDYTEYYCTPEKSTLEFYIEPKDVIITHQGSGYFFKDSKTKNPLHRQPIASLKGVVKYANSKFFKIENSMHLAETIVKELAFH